MNATINLFKHVCVCGLILLSIYTATAYASPVTKTFELGGSQTFTQSGTVDVDPGGAVIHAFASATYALAIPAGSLANYSNITLQVYGFNSAGGSTVQVAYGSTTQWQYIAEVYNKDSETWSGPWTITNYRLDSSAVGASSGMFDVIYIKLFPSSGWLNSFTVKSVKLQITYETAFDFLDKYHACMLASESIRKLGGSVAQFDVWGQDQTVAAENVLCAAANWAGTLAGHLAEIAVETPDELTLSDAVYLYNNVKDTIDDLRNIDFAINYTYTWTPLVGLRSRYWGPFPLTVPNDICSGLANRLGYKSNSSPGAEPNLAGFLKDWGNAWLGGLSNTQNILTQYNNLRAFFDSAPVSYRINVFTIGDSSHSLLTHAQQWLSQWSSMQMCYKDRAPNLATDSYAAAVFGQQMQDTLAGTSNLIDAIALPDPKVNREGGTLNIGNGQTTTVNFSVTNNGGFSSWVGLTISTNYLNVVSFQWPSVLPDQSYTNYNISNVASYQQCNNTADTNWQATNYPAGYGPSNPNWGADPVTFNFSPPPTQLPHQIFEIWRKLDHGQTVKIPVTFCGVGQQGKFWYRVAASTGAPGFYIYYPLSSSAGVENDQQGWLAFAPETSNNRPSIATPSLYSQSGRDVTVQISATDDSSQVSYMINWGDGTSTPWSQLFPGGYLWNQSHSYPGQNSTPYQVIAYVRDTCNLESQPSMPLQISVSSTAPNAPVNPYPADESIVAATSKLSWIGSDPDPGDTLTYDAYFGTNPSPQQPVQSNVTAMAYDPGPLTNNTTYYWKIRARDNHGLTTDSSIWQFSTTQPSEFSISAQPTTAIIAPGYPSQFQINVVPTGGFSSNVQFDTGSISIDPSTDALHFSFTPNPCNAGSSAMLLVTSDLSLVNDTYRITISGQGGGLTQFLTLTVSVVQGQGNASKIAIISKNSVGELANGNFTRESSISSDGRYVAFYSEATNLVSNDTNGYSDIFVHDNMTGQTTRVSVNSSGQQANGNSFYPSISSDGRYVAFHSFATNLVNDDTNGYSDIFVHDNMTAQTTRVSVNSSSQQANGDSFDPSISSDGRYVAFQSSATNLVIKNIHSFDIFVHDNMTGQTTRVSVNSSGQEANSSSYLSSISSDGRYVAFFSYATNLVNNDINGCIDIFVHDNITCQTTRVSVNSFGQEANGKSYLHPCISSDGRYVAFVSDATNLVSNDTNGFSDVFVHDNMTGQTTRVSVNSSGQQAISGKSGSLSISSDGRYVTFDSDATNLVSNDTNGFSDVFVHDNMTGQTTRVSENSSGQEANRGGGSYQPSISSDGRYVAFYSFASNLVDNDNNGQSDIFIYDTGPKPAILPGDLNHDGVVTLEDLQLLMAQWLSAPTNRYSDLGPGWGDNLVNLIDFSVFTQNWLVTAPPPSILSVLPNEMVWVSINDPGVSGHEGFNGQMSKYETTNAQYCQFLNAANASGLITVYTDNKVYATSDTNYLQPYYDLAGPGYTYNGATNGGAARINYSGGVFSVDSGFESHTVTYVTWYGATAFCNYYGYRLPTEWEWQAVADYDGSYTYGCGTTINNTKANILDSNHPYGTTEVGAFGEYGYGICDMAGNAWEWTSSIYSPGYRVVRGGGWHYGNANYCAVSFRGGDTPVSTSGDPGFRVCR